MSKSYFTLLIVAVGFGVARFLVTVTGGIEQADIFKDMAHVFVGGCFGAAIVATKRTQDEMPQTLGPLSVVPAIVREWRLWAIAVGLTVLEVVAFIARRA